MSRSKPSVLILAFSDVRRDPRVYRQIAALHEVCELTTTGECPTSGFPTKHVELVGTRLGRVGRMAKAVRLKTRQYEHQYWSTPLVRDAMHKLASRQSFDLIVANDLPTLPLALRLAGGRTKVYLDAHEYEPRHWDDQWVFRFFFQSYWDYICKAYLTGVAHMTAVSGGIANEYERNYGVRCEVIANTPEYVELRPSHVDAARIRMIHHGIVKRSRRLEHMIQLMDMLDDRFSLDLMLVNTDGRYMKSLRRSAGTRPRVRLIDPVPMLDIPRVINDYDIGLYMISPSGFNYRWALPNKLFEFIQARLAIASWPSPEVKAIVEREGIGVASEDFSVASMAAALNRLTTDDVRSFKQRAAEAAGRYNFESVKTSLRNIVRRLVG
jgi:glycosyltransferase involved in cell wall biosynthesis